LEIDEISPIIFWLEILIKITNIIHYNGQPPLHVHRAAGEKGHKMGNELHVLMGAPTACVTDASTSCRGGYYACSRRVLASTSSHQVTHEK